MLRYAVFSAISLLAQGLPPSVSDSGVLCKVANDEVDQVLARSNLNIGNAGKGNIYLDYYGFEREVGLYVFGWKLPISVTLKVSNGTLNGLNTMKRSDDAVDCSDSTNQTLVGTYEFGSQHTLSYDHARVKFLYWEAVGKFVIKPKLRMNVVLTNTTTDCRLENIRVYNQHFGEYYFETENSWSGCLMAKLLKWGLQAKEKQPSVAHQVVLWAQAIVFEYFTDAWCQRPLALKGEKTMVLNPKTIVPSVHRSSAVTEDSNVISK